MDMKLAHEAVEKMEALMTITDLALEGESRGVDDNLLRSIMRVVYDGLLDGLCTVSAALEGVLLADEDSREALRTILDDYSTFGLDPECVNVAKGVLEQLKES